MLRAIFIGLVMLHGLIHIMGFAKAYRFGHFTQLEKDISKPAGILWLAATVLFILTAGMIYLKTAWWAPALVAVLLSQTLIATVWSDARFGTLPNIIILVAALLGMGNWRFENSFRQDVRYNLEHNKAPSEMLLTEQDLQPLPAPVQRYLRYTGAVGKPRVYNYRVEFDGEMRDRGKDWFPFHSVQYNFTAQPVRLFFMKGKMFGVNVPGYHAYKNGKAAMNIKPFGWFNVVNATGPELDKAETVTIFNDMCLMAPATLIDPAIRWTPLDERSARAEFSCGGNSISATLYFNEKDELVNFISDDRYAVADMKQYRFSTPVSEYADYGGYRLASGGDAVWHYPEGAFTYGVFRMKTVRYNINE